MPFDRSVVAANVALLLVVAACVATPAAGWATRAAVIEPLKKDGAALSWKPLAAVAPDALLPGPPPAAWSAAFFRGLWATSQARAHVEPAGLTTMAPWNQRPVPLVWLEFVRDRLTGEGSREAILQEARTVATVSVAVYDAMLIAQRARAKYGRQAPARVAPFLVGTLGPDDGNPSYPSAHVAGAHAAAATVARLMPDAAAEAQRMAAEASAARLAGGFCYPSDVDAGQVLGAAAAQAVAKARSVAEDDEAAALQPWLRPRSGKGPLPASTRAAIARFPGEAPAAAWLRQVVDAVEAHGMSDLASARVLAYAGVAQADAAIAGAEAFPHAPALTRVVIAACAAEMLGDIFPGDARRFDGLAERIEQAAGASPTDLAAAKALGEKVALSDRRVYFFEIERREGY